MKKLAPGRLLNGLLETLYPEAANCMGCGSLAGTEYPWLCRECHDRLEKLDLLDLPRCYRCGRPLDGHKTCDECADWPNVCVSRSLMRYAYAPPVSGMVHGMKFAGVYRMTEKMAEDMYELLAREKELSFDCLAAVPMHPRRLRERGVNAPEHIARELSKRMDLPLLNALVRTRYTLQQAKLTPEMRQLALQGAFRVTDPSCVRDRRILLVDDVMTTGTTVNRCAETLYEAGASDVVSVAFAGHASLASAVFEA